MQRWRQAELRTIEMSREARAEQITDQLWALRKGVKFAPWAGDAIKEALPGYTDDDAQEMVKHLLIAGRLFRSRRKDRKGGW